MPDVVADGDGFMVVWGGFTTSTEDPGHAVDYYLYPHLWASRVHTDGTIHGADGTGSAASVLSYGGVPLEGASPKLAYNSYEDKYLIVYSSSYRTNYATSIAFRLMSRTGVITLPAEGYPWCYCQWEKQHYSVSPIPVSGKGWTIVVDSFTPDRWSRAAGIQRAFNIGPTGALPSDQPEKVYWPTMTKENLADNHLDFYIQDNLDKLHPYGSNAICNDGSVGVAVWTRYNLGGERGAALINADLYCRRVTGGTPWMPVRSRFL